MLKFFRKRTDPKKELHKLLGDYQLPSFPAVAMRALRMLRDDRIALSKVGAELATDPGVSARILGAIASATHALRHPVRDVGQAVTLLGRSRVEAMLLSVAVREALPRTPAAGLQPQSFWLNASRRAAVAQELAMVLHPRTAGAMFTTVLLQDMAIPLIAHAMPDRYAPVIDSWRGGKAGLAALERDVLGWDHAEAAGWMCRTWEFPDELTAAIACHHEANAEATEPEPAALRLVRALGDTEEVTDVDDVVQMAVDEFGMARDVCVARIDAGLERCSSWLG